METVGFEVYAEFDSDLSASFSEFMSSLTSPCMVVLDIKSYGGFCWVLEEMETAIKAKKAEGYVFVTNVEEYAYSCGLFLFLLGDIRTCSDYAEFLYHAAAIWSFERITSTVASEMLEELQRADEIGHRIIEENTTADPNIMAILEKNENFLSRTDLIFLGFMENEYELI